MVCLVMVQVAANEARGERAVSAHAPSRCASRSVAVFPSAVQILMREARRLPADEEPSLAIFRG
jgi:hypothetical protein